MELWIILGLVVLAVAAGVINKYIRRKKAAAQQEEKNIYPMW